MQEKMGDSVEVPSRSDRRHETKVLNLGLGFFSDTHAGGGRDTSSRSESSDGVHYDRGGVVREEGGRTRVIGVLEGRESVGG